MALPRRALLLFLVPALLFPPWAPRVDLDVALPPGSPLDWSSGFPAITPPRKPLYPRTGPAVLPRPKTEARAARLEPDVRFANAFGLVRILTWDIAGHLEWIQTRPEGPRSGRASLRPPPPSYGEPLHWVALVPLLRLLLHPDSLSGAETLAHLVEIGDPVLEVLASAAGEKDLDEVCAELRRRILFDAGPIPGPERGRSPRERTLARFTLEECLRDEPCDPSGVFGKRLFLFAEEIEPHLHELVRQEGLALRRNAVSALGRFRTASAQRALLAVASDADDPVTVVRALAALGRPFVPLDGAPLVERLGESTDPVLRVALIGALGRLRARSALPVFLALGTRALEEHDSDLLIAILTAVGAIPPGDQRQTLLELAREVRAVARGQPDSFRPRGEPRKQKPDVPDRPGTRAEILTQLAWLVEAVLDPTRRGVADLVLSLARGAPLDPRLSESGKGGTDPLGGIHPPVRFLYLEGLQRLGETERLAELAGADGLESALRGRALALLPWEAREPLAASWVSDSSASIERRIHALEVALLDRHPRAEELCRALLAEAAATAPERTGSGQRFLWMRALQHLSETEKLHTPECLPLLPHVERSPAERRSLIRELRERLTRLVRDATAGEPKGELRAQAASIVTIVLENRMNPLLEENAEDELEDALFALVENASRHADRTEEELVRQCLVRLLGPELDFFTEQPGRQLFEPDVPFAEELLLALGRVREPEAAELLIRLARDRKSELRAWTCLALGMCGQVGSAAELLSFLLDEDPFVRFSASESLRHLCGKDVEVDWMYGPSAERFAAAEEYRRWFLERER